MTEEHIAIVIAAWTLISLVVAATPTKADDELVSFVRRLLERLSFFQPRNSHGVLSMPGSKARPPVDDDAPPPDAPAGA